MALLALSILVIVRPVYASDTVRGVVFNDRNENGIRDRGENGIWNVCVSNGRDVVKTGWRGRYELPVDNDTIIFVIKPSGWMTPVDENNLPRFYYIHKPAGSPASKFEGVAPTGPLPESIDFPLYRHRESRDFRAILFGDTQPRDVKEVEYIAHDVVEELIGFDAAFGITLGDVVFNDLSVFEPMNAAIGKIGVPWYNVHGNHDTNQDTTDDVYSDETFERIYGPSHYAFNYGDVHVINLDSVLWEGGGRYHGEFGETQLEFVRNDLEFVSRKKLIVLVMHIPTFALADLPKLLALIEDRPHTLSISAHWHTQQHLFLSEDDGWHGPEPHHHVVQGTVCGSWWTGQPDEYGIPHATMSDGTPNGYSIITFDGSSYSIEYKVASRPADFQMSVYAPETVSAETAEKAEVVVNVFAGSDRSSVDMRFGETDEWIPMTHTEREDAYYQRLKDIEVQLHELHEEAAGSIGIRLPDISTSTHIWTGRLPADPPTGTHVIHVRTTDMFGHTYTAERIIRVE